MEDQATRVDDTPTNNMDMERLMGKADFRLQKLQTLPAASRSIVLQKTRVLREVSQGPNFRTFRKAVKMRREKEVEWNSSVKEKFASDAEKKQEVALGQERKRLVMLEYLKTCGGPFTNAEEVEKYMLDTDVTEVNKQKRLKKEMQFARESSTTLPRVDPIFKIQVVQATKKRRDKNAMEFAESLMVYLGKKADRTLTEYSTFQKSLRAVAIPPVVAS